jgi:hypothetical protein
LTALDAGRLRREPTDADTAVLIESRAEPGRFVALLDRYYGTARA